MVITGVPDDKVKAVIEDFNSEGAVEVRTEHESEGNWTVRASFTEDKK
jgi:hypothetical protein